MLGVYYVLSFNGGKTNYYWGYFPIHWDIVPQAVSDLSYIKGMITFHINNHTILNIRHCERKVFDIDVYHMTLDTSD